jgi:hypothetical protein
MQQQQVLTPPPPPLPPFLFTCSQAVGPDSLTVTISFAQPVSMSQIELSVGERGAELLLELTAGATQSQEKCGSESHKIELKCRVVPETLGAKFSKKKNTLTLTAQIVI